MNYFTIKKFAQIENLLQQKGFDSSLINQVKLAPKDIKRQIGNLFDKQDVVTTADIQNILQATPTNVNLKKSNPLDSIFLGQPYTQQEFFSQIPDGYKKYITKILFNHEVKPEDLPTLLQNIQDFEKLKKRTALPIDRDINNYQSYRQLIETLIRFNEGEYKENPRLKVDPRNLEGVELASTQGQYNIWKVTDAESLKQIGEGTKWCTRESFKPASRAEGYLKNYGSIFVITNGPNLAYQFTPWLDEFQDVNNVGVKGNFPIDVDFLVPEAVKENGLALQYASKDLRNDKGVAFDAVKNEAEAMRFVSAELRKDFNFLMSCVKAQPHSLYFAGKDAQNTEKIVYEAVQLDGRNLYDASYRLKDNFDIVLAAVHKSGTALDAASDKMKNNSQIVLEAVKQNGYALLYASERLKNNFEIVLEAVKQEGKAIMYASNELKNNAEIALAAIKQTLSAKSWVSEKLLRNPQFMKQVEQITKKASGWYHLANNTSLNGMRK